MARRKQRKVSQAGIERVKLFKYMLKAQEQVFCSTKRDGRDWVDDIHEMQKGFRYFFDNNDDLARQIADDMLKLYGKQKWRKYLVSNS
tara:strand:+ start:167 stop:430 length:264 start_codon:yes stop_codon:yes gene_type:complete